MFSLCTITSADYAKEHGATPEDPGNLIRDDIILIGYLENTLLVLTTSKDKVFVKQESVPAGYNFCFRPEWGTAVTEAVIHKVISTLREEAYPPMADYLDAKVKGDAAQEQAYLDACAAVKEKYPKFSW
jgi:hypothetical protein